MIGDLASYSKVLARCSHCSLCEAVCPVFLADLLETNVARARVDIIDQVFYRKAMPVTPQVKEIINRCLLCTRCTQECGGAVPVHEIVMTARHKLYKGKRQNWFQRYILANMIENKGLAGLPALFIWMAQRLHVAPAGFPSVNLRPFNKRYRGNYPPEGQKRGKVAYFVGCATNTMDIDTGESVMKVLARNGIEVVIPEKLMCCGIPALGEGDIAKAQRAVRNNIIILAGQEVDAIITDCTSCGMMLKKEMAKVLPAGDPLAADAARVSEKVFEVTDYLNKLGLSADPDGLNKKYTYHIPCHSGWTDTLNEAPVQLLAKIPGVHYCAMEQPEKCCGAGGSFFMHYGELARKIGKRKAADIEATDADVVISQCPGCRSYISHLSLPGRKMLHPIGLLRRAYKL